MTIKEKIRKICTYNTDEGTSGYLLDEDRFAKIFALLDQSKNDTIKEVREKIKGMKKEEMVLDRPLEKGGGYPNFKNIEYNQAVKDILNNI